MSDETMHLFNETVIDAQPMSASHTSASLDVREVTNYCVQAVWSAGSTPVGTFDLQASNDNTNFTSLLSAPAAVTGDSGSLMINVQNPGYGFIKVIYTKTSGDGILSVTVNAKAE